MTSTISSRVSPVKPLAGEDLANFTAFAFRESIDLPVLVSTALAHFLLPGTRSHIVADCHAEAVRQQVGDAQDNDGRG